MNAKLYTLSACAVLALALPGRAETHVSVDLGIRLGPPAPVIVHTGPPRHSVERVPVTPGPGYIWIAGHHSWARNGWVWVPGAWIRPPRPGAVWVEGRFDERSRNWVEGYWTLPAPPPAPVVEVISAPPPPRHEVIIARPSPNHIWIDGYWVWRGHRHEWVAGHWELPPRAHVRWVAPRWERRGNSYVFVEGVWR